MPRYAQLVMGPAGSGKSTYCSRIQRHCEDLKRSVQVINLDPAAEYFDYPVMSDIRELISVDDAMEDEELHYGPNGGLVFCMEYLAQNFDWLEEELGEMEDDYILFDCPGQIELYTHIPVMSQLIEQLKAWNFNVCAVFIIDSQFMIEASKFVSGVMTALSTMVHLEVPHLNVMGKLDLLNKKARKDLDRFLEPDMNTIMEEEFRGSSFNKKYQKLNQAIAQLIDDYSLVKFFPLDITDEESVNTILLQTDLALQYGEDIEPREPKDMVEDPLEEDDDSAMDLEGAIGGNW